MYKKEDKKIGSLDLFNIKFDVVSIHKFVCLGTKNPYFRNSDFLSNLISGHTPTKTRIISDV